MKIYRMTMDMKFECVPPDSSTDDFDDFTTRVMDTLCDLEEADTGISDPDITASLTNLALSVGWSVPPQVSLLEPRPRHSLTGLLV